MGRGQELLDAARKADRSTVEKIIGQITKRSGPFPSIRRGPGVNVKDDNGYTPLHHACLNGHEDIVQLLLSADASPCVVDKIGATPLHLAAFNDHSRVVAMLLAHNSPPVNIDQLTLKHETALLMAAAFGHTDCVSMLISRGADVTIQNSDHLNALDLAAQFDRKDVVKLLLRMRPQLIDQYRMPVRDGVIFTHTPLHLASKHGRADVVRELLSAGVDPNLRTEQGAPLHVAACFARDSVVRLLLRKGADLKARDKAGKTVMQMLAGYSEESTRKVRQVIQEFKSQRCSYDSEEDLPPFPVIDSPPAPLTAPETQEISNKNESFLSPSSSSLTKIHPQSFVKKLASKCLGLKAKFNSAPNISNSTEPEVDVGSKRLDHKNSTSNTLLIGNSKFFKILSKKEESGEIVCNDEFDTISLDRLGTLNRDSVVNRSNRSCPGFKTSLPNITENNEHSDQESVAESLVIIELNCDKNEKEADTINETINTNLSIFEPRERFSVISNKSSGSATLINDCYESCEFDGTELRITNNTIPRPLPRPNVPKSTDSTSKGDMIYENVINIKPKPTPAARTHIPLKHPLDEVEKQVLYENVTILRDIKPDPPKRTLFPNQIRYESLENDSSRSVSRSSTVSSDSMVDESNLEDILLSAKSKSFRHGQVASYYSGSYKSNASRTKSNASNSSEGSDVSAIENVDCSEDVDVNKAVYLSMTGTLPIKKSKDKGNKKVLFRHKTFTNIEVDRNSVKINDLPQWNNIFLKETLAHYHIRGTGHCIYKAPTVEEFIYIFNRDTLHKDVPPFTKVPNDKRDSYFETAICFCKPRPPKHHNSAEDLLASGASKEEEEKVSIDFEVLQNRREIFSTSFKCFCESGTCKFHSNRRESLSDLIVKFSAINRSISTPDITLDHSPYPTSLKSKLPKNMSVPQNLEEPAYAVVNIEEIVERNKSIERAVEQGYTLMSHPSTLTSQQSTLSSNSSTRPYSIKDIAEVISLNRSTSTASTMSTASDVYLPVRKSSSSEYSGHWSLQSCNSNVTIKSDLSFKSCLEESSDDGSDGTLHSDDDSDADTIKSDISTAKRPWVHSDSFRFGSNSKPEIETIAEEIQSSFEDSKLESMSSKFESGISVEGSESSSSGGEDDSGIPRGDTDTSLGASLERGSVTGGVRSGSGRRRWDDLEGTSEGDALSISSAASSCAPLHLMHHYEHSKVSPTPPKKPPRRNLSVSPTHANSPSSGYSYELRIHARSQDDLDDIQGAKHYLKHGRSVDHYESKLSYSEYEENHNSPRVVPTPYPRPSLKQRSQPVAITAMYENVVVKEQNPRRKLRRNIQPGETNEPRMNEREQKYLNQERSSLESLLDDQSMNSPSDCERNNEGPRIDVPLSPSHYAQPPTPDHPPPSAKQAENSIHERIRPLSQLIMEVVEEIRIRKKSQGDVTSS